MPSIETVRLEMLRSGPAHNQLLSPLTPYIALCAGDGPVTITIPLEHRHLLNRLERLRYVSGEGQIPEPQRQAEIIELGPLLGDVLARVPGLNAQLVQSHRLQNTVVHVQLVLWGSELALVPFELVTAPAGFPGSGLPLLTQGDVPVTLTREVRRTQPLQVDWHREPRILFAWASPAGVTPVPARAHLSALRRALDPWIPWRPTAEERVTEVRKRLTILPDANLEEIRRACAALSFTHVHILAHGAKSARTGDSRYGLMLTREGNRSEHDIVEGEALAQALRATSDNGAGQSRPTVVTLATCDSGNVGSPLVPGGSIAHDLHAFGVPWVIASQFPLTMAGSIIVAETWYARILRGDDPRWVVQDLRRRLNGNVSTAHDWASLVVYAVSPPDLSAQVEQFRSRQLQSQAGVLFDKAERMMDAGERAHTLEAVHAVCVQVRDVLRLWCAEASGGDSAAERRERAERLGTSAAAEKRIAELFWRRAWQLPELPQAEVGSMRDNAGQALRKARDLYEAAFSEDFSNHWVLTQLLSLNAVLKRDDEELPTEKWTAARVIAEQQRNSRDRSAEAWALGTLAEIELLGIRYGTYRTPEDLRGVTARVEDYCRRIGMLMGKDSFHVSSTRRQFQRYAGWWSAPGQLDWPVIEAALGAFPREAPPSGQ